MLNPNIGGPVLQYSFNFYTIMQIIDCLNEGGMSGLLLNFNKRVFHKINIA